MIDLDLDLAFARGVLDGSDQRFGRGGGRNFLDDDGGFVFDLDLGADLDRAFAVGVIARVHQAAGREIGQALERLLLENRDLRFEQFGKIVRQESCTDRPTAMPSVPSMSISGSLRRQRDRLLVAAVVARNELGELVVEDLVARQFGQPAFDVTRSSRADRR